MLPVTLLSSSFMFMTFPIDKKLEGSILHAVAVDFILQPRELFHL
jgi:hypothetical protein